MAHGVVEQETVERLVFVHGDLSDHRTWSEQVPAGAPDEQNHAFYNKALMD